MKEFRLNKLVSSQNIKEIALLAESDYTIIYVGEFDITFYPFAAERMLQVAEDSAAGLLYADYSVVKNGQKTNVPLCDYQDGSLRDDFDFGYVLFVKTSALKEMGGKMSCDYRFAGLYDLRLKIAQKYPIIHLNECLYAVNETDTVAAETKQFAYVDPKNREVQIEMEAVCTQHLKDIGAYLKPQFKQISFDKIKFDNEASVIIPVRNRVNTIEDAILSVLQQETTFPYNLIIVDNHSTDGTSDVIRKYATDKRVVHLIPETTDLNIGGCWNMAVHSPACGKFAIQLDSDDLYAHSNVLQIIVETFYQQQCAMIVGTYQMVNFKLETIPPGMIDHKEWTPENGRNNALRINGLGAPRAFYTPLLREFNLPNTGYGEDYAIGLRISREYQIGRIYDVLYLCRRWDGNSDAAAGIEKMNGFNTYKDRIRTWEIEARKQHRSHSNHASIAMGDSPQTKKIDFDGFSIHVQFNPERVKSTCAVNVQNDDSCFLCAENRPVEQDGIPFEDFTILCNPYPVFSKHLTIAGNEHKPQSIIGNLPAMLRLARILPSFAVFYNGPECGASAPMHLHFQAGTKQEFPIYNDFATLKKRFACTPTTDSRSLMIRDGVRTFYVLQGDNPENLADSFTQEFCHAGKEPNLNVLVWYGNKQWTICVFERKQHRPAQFYEKGDAQLLISPAAVEMAGLFITPRLTDFEKISKADLCDIYNQVVKNPNFH